MRSSGLQIHLGQAIRSAQYHSWPPLSVGAGLVVAMTVRRSNSPRSRSTWSCP